MHAAGARVDVWDGHQQTPLHVGATNGHEAMCALLLQHGATIAGARGVDGWTAMDCAVSRNQRDSHVAVLEVLVHAGAVEHSNVLSAMHVSCLNNSLRSVELLAKAGVPVDQVNQQGCSPHGIARAEGHTLLATWLEGWAASTGVQLCAAAETTGEAAPEEGANALADLQLLHQQGVITDKELARELLVLAPQGEASEPHTMQRGLQEATQRGLQEASSELVEQLLQFSIESGHSDLLEPFSRGPGGTTPKSPPPERLQTRQHRSSQALFRDLHELKQQELITEHEFKQGKQSSTAAWRALKGFSSSGSTVAPEYRTPPGWSRRRRIFLKGS